MVIECRRCLKRFNLDESLLRLEGSKVKCTKCGNIFPAFPPSPGTRKHPSEREAKVKHAASESRNLTAPAVQKRQHTRIGISVPVSCAPEDSDGKPLRPYRGHITEVSQAGVAIELPCNSISDFVSMSFVNHEGETIHLKGRVVHSAQKESGKLRIGVSLLGASQSIGRFVANLVRAHHFANKARPGVRIAPRVQGIENPN